MSSRTLLATTAGILMGAYASAPSHAADLGGGCCADLEERVAELEATTARKGNRVVSLQVYGQVNKALMIWDDGEQSDAYVVDNDYSGSRVGFTGKAAIRPGWTAGFLVELDIQDSASDKVDNGGVATAFDEGNDNEIVIRYSNAYIESEELGRMTIGQGSTAADGVNEVVLGNSLRNSDIQMGNNFTLRDGNTGGYTTIQLKQVAANLDGNRDDVIRYDLPTVYGFILSASWGDNDYADLVLRFKKEWNSVRIAAAIGYQWDDTNDASLSATSFPTSFVNSDFTVLSGSVSVMHIPTGIYGAFQRASGISTTGPTHHSGTPNSASRGSSSLTARRRSTASTASMTISSTQNKTAGAFESSEARRWGFGIVQKFDSAALELYGQATFWSFDATSGLGVDQNLEDLSTVMLGSNIEF